jgi:hypothetical protein
MDLCRALQERKAAADDLSSRVARFGRRPFPAGWAKRVCGVGLASSTTRAEHALRKLSGLDPVLPSYRLRIAAQPAASELRAILDAFDRFPPALPPEPRPYFDDLRQLVSDALSFLERWWAADDAAAGSRLAV